MYTQHEWSKCQTELSPYIVIGEGLAFTPSCSMSAGLVPITKTNLSTHIHKTILTIILV
ncbi:BgTH12-04080 [Blumeria graminis f. sp. triticale]|uniref:BgTH12-04080 n=1 Tax=Blumeria graminis f. sp. triticale TaxID=1689686 RepID=A0A9W4CWA7_BLUGR|nr:BgTH12-04080 [Blumeria graminis f. sp. triticale]